MTATDILIHAILFLNKYSNEEPIKDPVRPVVRAASDLGADIFDKKKALNIVGQSDSYPDMILDEVRECLANAIEKSYETILQPCGHCKSSLNREIWPTTTASRALSTLQYQYVCSLCGTSGPRAKTEKEAIVGWNRVATSPGRLNALQTRIRSFNATVVDKCRSVMVNGLNGTYACCGTNLAPCNDCPKAYQIKTY